jgi:hypothetical protein
MESWLKVGLKVVPMETLNQIKLTRGKGLEFERPDMFISYREQQKQERQ